MFGHQISETNSITHSSELTRIPGLRLLGRGEDGDSEADRFRDDCCPGIASSASSIIRFYADRTPPLEQLHTTGRTQVKSLTFAQVMINKGKCLSLSHRIGLDRAWLYVPANTV